MKCVVVVKGFICGVKQIYLLIELWKDQFQSVWTQKIELIQSNCTDPKQTELAIKCTRFYTIEELKLIS